MNDNDLNTSNTKVYTSLVNKLSENVINIKIFSSIFYILLYTLIPFWGIFRYFKNQELSADFSKVKGSRGNKEATRLLSIMERRRSGQSIWHTHLDLGWQVVGNNPIDRPPRKRNLLLMAAAAVRYRYTSSSSRLQCVHTHNRQKSPGRA